MNKFYILLTLLIPFTIVAQQHFPVNHYKNEFNQAYQQYPDVPRGVLEAVAYSMTRFHHVQNTTESCTGIPKVYGVMGLTLDGKNYFRNNLNLVAQLSGISVNEIINNPQQNIMAYAAAYHVLLSEKSFNKNKLENHVQLLIALSELPNNGLQQDFALTSHLYSIFNFLDNPSAQQTYQFPNHHLNLTTIFGAENLAILRSSKIVITENSVQTNKGKEFSGSTFKSPDYPPALTNLTSCNFSTRGVPVSAVTIHTIQGTYAGAISWANNCSSNVSYHYVLRSSDGQVTQVVLEANKAWHVGSENPYTIGMEHEGYVSDSTWYTAAMYQSSADVVKDITQSGYGISPLRTSYFPWARTTNYNASSIPGSCVHIKGHQHYPNQSHTDPGANWDWDYYYKLLNNSTPITSYTSTTGTVTDLGGPAPYTNDERTLYLIEPTNAQSITLTVNQFNLESTWDYLYIYDGTTPFATKIGEYTGTSIPSTITVNSGNVLIEFRSDCATSNDGYNISWTSVIADTIQPTSTISTPPNPASGDFTSTFTDADNVGGSGVKHQFYQVADTDGTQWRANEGNGFFNDDFDTAIHTDWIDSSGVWSITGGYLTQTDEVNSNTNLFAAVNQNSSSKYLYHFQNRISGSGSNKRAGFHYMCDDASQPNRGNSYFVWFRQDDAKLQFYKVTNDVFTLEKDVPFSFNANQWYDVKIVYDQNTGATEVWWDDEFIASWTDASPLTTGNQISLRSGNCVYDVEELRVYKTRTGSELITVGSGSTNDIRYQGTPAGTINSIVIDSAYNVSTLVTENVNVDLTTSIVESSASSFVVYPNPVIDQLVIQTNRPEKVQITMTDVTGRLILSVLKNPIEGKINIDLSSYQLSPGTYFVQVNDQTLSLIKK